MSFARQIQTQTLAIFFILFTYKTYVDRVKLVQMTQRIMRILDVNTKSTPVISRYVDKLKRKAAEMEMDVHEPFSCNNIVPPTQAL